MDFVDDLQVKLKILNERENVEDEESYECQ